MKYISGYQALNLPCSLETCGDWHTSGLQWEILRFRESDGSIFGNWGIEDCTCIPEHMGTFKIADTIRACLDLLIDGNFAVAQGMNEDFICNEKYDMIVFDKVILLRSLSHWSMIDVFMGREYKMKWLRYKEGLING